MPTFADLLSRYEAPSADTLFGHSQRPGGRWEHVRPTQMTIGEVLAFQKDRGPNSYGQWVKDRLAASGQRARIATPVGSKQIVGTTLENAVTQMGLSLDTPFDSNTQDMIGRHLLEQRLQSARNPAEARAALRAEWEGFKHVSDDELDEAILAYNADPSTFYSSDQQNDKQKPTGLGSYAELMRDRAQDSRERQGGMLDYIKGYQDSAIEVLMPDAKKKLGEKNPQAPRPELQGGAGDNQLRGGLTLTGVSGGRQIADPLRGSGPNLLPLPLPGTEPRYEVPLTLPDEVSEKEATKESKKDVEAGPAPQTSAPTESIRPRSREDGENANKLEKRQAWGDWLSALGVAYGQAFAGQAPNMPGALADIQQRRQASAMALREEERAEQAANLNRYKTELDARRVAAEEARIALDEQEFAVSQQPQQYPVDYAKRTMDVFPETAPYFDMLSAGMATNDPTLIDTAYSGISKTLERAGQAGAAQISPEALTEYNSLDPNVPDEAVRRAQIIGSMPPEQLSDFLTAAEAVQGGAPPAPTQLNTLADAVYQRARDAGEPISRHEAILEANELLRGQSSEAVELVRTIMDNQAAEDVASAVTSQVAAIQKSGVDARTQLGLLRSVEQALVEVGSAEAVRGETSEEAGVRRIFNRLVEQFGGEDAGATFAATVFGMPEEAYNTLNLANKTLMLELANVYGIRGQSMSDGDREFLESMFPSGNAPANAREFVMARMQSRNLLDRARDRYVTGAESNPLAQKERIDNFRLDAADTGYLNGYYELRLRSQYERGDDGGRLYPRDVRALGIAAVNSYLQGNDRAFEQLERDFGRFPPYAASTNVGEEVRQVLNQTFPPMTAQQFEILAPELTRDPMFYGYFDLDKDQYVLTREVDLNALRR